MRRFAQGRFAQNSGPALRTALSCTVALLAALVLVVAPGLDVHRAQQVGASFGVRTLISEEASHPNAPLHVETSPQTEEDPCAFCLFSGQIGSGLLGKPIPGPHFEVRTATLASAVSSPRSTALRGLPSRAPPLA